MPELQFDVFGSLRKVPAHVVCTHVQSSDTVTFTLRFDHHKYLLFKSVESWIDNRGPGNTVEKAGPAIPQREKHPEEVQIGQQFEPPGLLRTPIRSYQLLDDVGVRDTADAHMDH